MGAHRPGVDHALLKDSKRNRVDAVLNRARSRRPLLLSFDLVRIASAMISLSPDHLIRGHLEQRHPYIDARQAMLAFTRGQVCIARRKFGTSCSGGRQVGP